MIELVVPGKPMGKQRPKHGRGYTYTPAETVNYETLVKQLYITKYPDTQLAGPVKMSVKAYFDIPKSTSNKKSRQMIAGLIRPTKKPDMDNIVKIIADALNTLAYHDDSQVVELEINKYYGEQPRVEIMLEEIG